MLIIINSFSFSWIEKESCGYSNALKMEENQVIALEVLKWKKK